MANAPSKHWPVTCRWIAAGTLAVYSAIGCQKIYAAPDFPSAAAPAPRPYDIPAGPLHDVAAAFERESGASLTFADPGLADLTSSGVSGLFTLNRALDRLVEGTGLRWSFTAPSGVRLELAPVSSSVDVTTSIDELSASMPKFTGSIDDAPQTIDTVTAQTMEEQNITTLRDTLRDVAGISLAAGEGGAQGDNLTIRGFTARNDLFIDGMRDFGSYYRDPFNLEEVEVLEGPASVDFGRGSTGGVVNQATKQPTLNQRISASFDAGTDATRRLTADFNQPLGKTTSFRLNVMGDEADVAGRNVAENRRMGLAPSLSLGLGTPTRLTFSYVHQNADDIPDYGIPWLFNGPAPVNRANYYGFPNANFLRTYDDIGTLRAEHDFRSHFSLRNQARYADYLRDAQITEPQIANSPTLATPLSAIAINRNEISVNSVEAFAGDQLDLTGKFAHDTIVTGVEADREISDPRRLAYTNVPTTSLLNPDPDQPFTGYSVAVSSLVHTTANSTAAYILNTWKPIRKWELATGIRFDRFNTHYTQAIAPASALNRLDEMPSWRAALSYHPVDSATLYAAAGTSFNPSAETLSLSAANANLPPEKNRTEEIGAKWRGIRAALFDTVKTNAREPDPQTLCSTFSPETSESGACSSNTRATSRSIGNSAPATHISMAASLHRSITRPPSAPNSQTFHATPSTPGIPGACPITGRPAEARTTFPPAPPVPPSPTIPSPASSSRCPAIGFSTPCSNTRSPNTSPCGLTAITWPIVITTIRSTPPTSCPGQAARS